MSTDGGGYITRGRGQAIERLLLETEARLQAQIDELRSEVAAARTLPTELARAIAGVQIDLIRNPNGRERSDG